MADRIVLVGCGGIGSQLLPPLVRYLSNRPVLTLRAGLPPEAIAVLVALVTIATIATRTSLWYVTAAGTAFLILILSLFGETDQTHILELSWERAIANVLGAGIALFYGVLIANLIVKSRHPAPDLLTTEE